MHRLPLLAWLLVVVFGTTSVVTPSAATSCQWTSPSGSYYDFSALTTSAGVSIAPPPGGTSYKFWLNVCGIMRGTPPNECGEGQSATLCMKLYTGSPIALARWGPQPDPAWTMAGQAVQLTFQNGEPINNVKPTIVMYFVCGTTQTPTYTMDSYDVNTHQATVHITSSECCTRAPPNNNKGKKSGLSGGWIFIIFLSVTIPVYVIAGCLIQHKRLGTPFGMSSCPNVEFWRELPGLCKDGCRWTWAKLRGLCNRGGGGSGGSDAYEQYQ